MPKKKLILLLVCGVGLNGCAANVLVYPREDKTMEIVAVSAEEEYALSAVLKKAEQVCKEEEKKFVVISREVKYQGIIDETANKVAKQASTAIFVRSGINMPTPARSDDYEATLVIKCA